MLVMKRVRTQLKKNVTKSQIERGESTSDRERERQGTIVEWKLKDGHR